MTILGIDPGTARMGWGVINVIGKSEALKFGGTKGLNGKIELLGYGSVVTEKEDGIGKRLTIIRRELRKLVGMHKPNVMVVERLFFGMNAKTAIAVGQATGVILLTASELSVPVFEYTGLQVKFSVAGHGRADKKLVQTTIRRIFGIDNLSFKGRKKGWDDASDALAIAICHVLR
jgi:crossover junction endodeoxyribonuclease RuvC